MLRPSNLSYWRKGLEVQNFGDFLSELLYAELAGRGLFERNGGKPKQDYAFIHLIGSVISDSHVRAAVEHAGDGPHAKIAFWGCGKRDAAPLDEELRRHCVFLGARGPLTRDALGLPPETPLGDPALLLPTIYRPRLREELRFKTMCVPHFLETQSDEDLRANTGADVVLRPNIAPRIEDARAFIDRLVSAEFVLCGALHAAIVRYAYGRKFSYFDSGYIDVPFKWRDFSASVGIGDRFATTVAQGEALYGEQTAGRIGLPDLREIWRCAPLHLPRRLRRRIADVAAGAKSPGSDDIAADRIARLDRPAAPS